MLPKEKKEALLAKRPLVSAGLLVVLGLLFGITLVSSFGSWKGVSFAFGASDPQLGGPLPTLPNDNVAMAFNSSFEAVAAAVQPTVVQISVKSEAPKISKQDNPFQKFFNFPFGGGDGQDGGGGSPYDFQNPGIQEGIGSGVIITSDGYILTNNHVVENAAEKNGVRVKLTDKRVYDGKVVGTDPTTDLAVIKIDATNLPVAALGNSDDLRVGEWVMAVGNPLALESTVTTGIVSSLGRAIDIFDRNKTQNYGIANFIQTDAAINPGNSGGGLFDLKGRVIGINAAIASKTGMFEGYGFAIPINMVKSVTMDIIKTGHVNRGYIGVVIRAVDQTDAEALGLDRPRGVRIDNVGKSSAGEAAGLKENDVILNVDGHEVNEANQLQGLIGMHHANDIVALRIWRDGHELEKNVKLKARSDIASSDQSTESTAPDAEKTPTSKESATVESIGLTVRNLTSAEKDQYATKNGVFITAVQPGSEAYDRGVGGASRVITALNRETVKNVDDFVRLVEKNKGKAVGVTVHDDKGDSHFVAIRIPS